MAKKTKTPKATLISFLLDETSSMGAIRADTINGFNAYVRGLAEKIKGDASFSFVKFNSSKIDKVHVGVKLNKVVPINMDTYKPNGATPLIDATMKIILATEGALKKRKDKPNVQVIIQTDGEENVSTEFTFQDLVEMIAKKEKLGWVFNYIGAGIDAYETATKLGIGVGNTMSYDMGASGATFDALATNTVNYANTGLRASASFSGKQKLASGDVHESKYTGDVGGHGIVTPTVTVNKTDTKETKTSVVDDFSL